MDRRTLLAAGLASGFALAAHALRAQALTVATADAALRDARDKAAAANRKLLLMFHATWCAPCKMMDAFLADKQVAAILNPHFDYLTLNVLERDDSGKKLEMAGVGDLYKSIAGERAGVPFFAAYGTDGAIIANSIDPGKGNVGFPVTKPELAYFRIFLRKTVAPTKDQENLLIKRAVAAAKVPV
jgi:thiol-disulfide isomerase/thioredoxin